MTRLARHLALFFVAAALAQGCFLFGEEEDAGVPDGAPPGVDAGPQECPPGLDFLGECDGTTLRYCDEEQLRVEECAIGGLGIGECFELDAELGNVCGTREGEPCFFEDGAGGTFTTFCIAPATGCTIGSDGSACEAVGGCADGSEGSCAGDSALVFCRGGQPIYYDCASLGGRCEVGSYCVDVPEGGFCEADLVSCASGLSCVDATCTDGPPPPPDAGPEQDAGVPPGACVRPGNLTVVNQASLDGFRDSGCDEIEGNLTLNGTTLTALDGLENLRVVGGELMLANCDLTDLSALSNLERVGDLIVIECDALPDLDGLERLASTTALTVVNNDQLTSLQGLRGLRAVGDELGEDGIIVRGNPRLTSLAGLEGITAANFLTVDACPLLSSLEGLRNLRTVNLVTELTLLGGAAIRLSGLERTGSLRVRENGSATSVAFPSLTTVEGSLLVSSHPSLTSVSFPALMSLDGPLTIQLNPVLSQCIVDSLHADLVAQGYSGSTSFGGNLACP